MSVTCHQTWLEEWLPPTCTACTACRFWSELARTAWCPVVSEPPAAGLPWPDACPRLSPPRFVRPPGDMWLASACMHVLDGECRWVGVPCLRVPACA